VSVHSPTRRQGLHLRCAGEQENRGGASDNSQCQRKTSASSRGSSLERCPARAPEQRDVSAIRRRSLSRCREIRPVTRLSAHAGIPPPHTSSMRSFVPPNPDSRTLKRFSQGNRWQIFIDHSCDPHDLTPPRSTANSTVLAAGVPQTVIRARMGHVLSKRTERYFDPLGHNRAGMGAVASLLGVENCAAEFPEGSIQTIAGSWLTLGDHKPFRPPTEMVGALT
jgi:hypothetical protein